MKDTAIAPLYGSVVPGVPSLRHCSGVLFDFNGTLSDDEGILRRLFIGLAQGAGIGPAADRYQQEMAGRSDREIAEVILAPALGDTRSQAAQEAIGAFLARLYNVEIERESPIRPETKDLVGALHAAGIRLGVVTGAGKGTVLSALRRAGLADFIDVVITHEDVRQGKPHPEGFLAAARALELRNPATVAVFEDSVPGLQAAAAAGMIPLAVRGTHPPEKLRPLSAAVLDGLRPQWLDLELVRE